MGCFHNYDLGPPRGERESPKREKGIHRSRNPSPARVGLSFELPKEGKNPRRGEREVLLPFNFKSPPNGREKNRKKRRREGKKKKIFAPCVEICRGQKGGEEKRKRGEKRGNSLLLRTLLCPINFAPYFERKKMTGREKGGFESFLAFISALGEKKKKKKKRKKGKRKKQKEKKGGGKESKGPESPRAKSATVRNRLYPVGSRRGKGGGKRGEEGRRAGGKKKRRNRRESEK